MVAKEYNELMRAVLLTRSNSYHFRSRSRSKDAGNLRKALVAVAASILSLRIVYHMLRAGTSTGYNRGVPEVDVAGWPDVLLLPLNGADC